MDPTFPRLAGQACPTAASGHAHRLRYRSARFGVSGVHIDLPVTTAGLQRRGDDYVPGASDRVGVAEAYRDSWPHLTHLPTRIFTVAIGKRLGAP